MIMKTSWDRYKCFAAIKAYEPDTDGDYQVDEHAGEAEKHLNEHDCCLQHGLEGSQLAGQEKVLSQMEKDEEQLSDMVESGGEMSPQHFFTSLVITRSQAVPIGVTFCCIFFS